MNTSAPLGYSSIPQATAVNETQAASATALLNELVSNFCNNDLAKLDVLKNELLGMCKGIRFSITE